MRKRKTDFTTRVLILVYVVAAFWVYHSLPFFEAAAVDGLLTVLLLVSLILLARSKREEEEGGAWEYIKKGIRWWE